MFTSARARNGLLLSLVSATLGLGCASLPNRPTAAREASPATLRPALKFHAALDRGTDADYATGDAWVYHAPALDRIRDARPGLPAGGVAVVEPTGGRHGGALHFTKPSPAVVFYKAKDNVPWRGQDWGGTVSFWLRTDLDGLAPGFCDPVNLTPRAWNDAAFFVEFERRTNDVPFRLGAYADLRVWNPLNRNWGDLTAAEKPLVTIPVPPFQKDRWTHVAFTWDHFNTGRTDGLTQLYLDGALVGAIRGRTQTFTWNPAEARLHLGVGYVGWMDDLAVFDRALTVQEVQLVRSLPRGVKSLYAK